MRAALTVILLLLTTTMLMGMGNLGGTPEGKIPETKENIKVQIIDHSGVSTDLSRFSMAGEVFFEGRRGDGLMNVFFRDLKEISFGPVSGNDAQADLLLKSGRHLQLKVNKSTLFYGDSGYGAYRIPAGDINRIVFPK